MNVHHLELFYYVARHGGISRAVRHMPYGIQQPAVSGQILRLEQDLGKRLFVRTPFQLTPEGEELYAFVRPFFDNLAHVATRLRQQSAPRLRIGASELVLRDHLPHVLARFRPVHPELRLTFRSGLQAQMEALLQEREIDLAIVPLESRPPARINCEPLLQVPLVLQVARTTRFKSAEELWALSPVPHPLIMLPPTETVSRLFRRGLQKLKVDWPATMEGSSLDLITQYVANGYGMGVNVDSGRPVAPGVRVLPLPGFPVLELVALWRSPAPPLLRELLDAMRAYARETWPERAPPAITAQSRHRRP